jgi:hypothetical protein
MSDLEAVMERLLTDPSFQAALKADPERALVGYRLDPGDRELLGVEVVSGAGEDRTVEIRTSKSGVVGLLGPVAAAFGVAAGGSSQTFGTAPSGSQSFGGPGGTQSLGTAPEGGALAGSQSFGGPSGSESFGNAPARGDSSFGDSGTESVGTSSTERFGSAPQVGRTIGVEATGYRTRVDVDGDGTWDANTAYERADGGVDIHVDHNRDGVSDFVGHDYNRDGLVDDAEFDNNFDGTLETHERDTNRDGWMDRSEHIPGTT